MYPMNHQLIAAINSDRRREAERRRIIKAIRRRAPRPERRRLRPAIAGRWTRAEAAGR